MYEKNYNYQWELLKDNQNPKKNINEWKSEFGPIITQRDEEGKCKKVKFKILIDNPNIRIFLTGTFNNWENKIENLTKYELKKDIHSIFAELEIENIKHKDEYKYIIYNEKDIWYMQDPAAVYFNDNGNCIFWDFQDSTTYKQKYELENNFNKSIKILQTDLPGLIVHYANKDNVCGKNINQKEYYKFITESGIIEKIKELGFTAIQFLPFAQTIDGDNWKLRYLVPFQYAIQKNWGNPDEFAKMIDEFHKHNISVIGDFVLGHFPDRKFKIFGQDCTYNGIHLWKKGNGEFLYLKDETSWGSRRPDIDNKFVRKFLISSCISFIKNYKIDGFRIDNVDGILRYGDTGEGEERPNGRRFLRELNYEIYSYNPTALINYEAHYYYGDNSKMLVAPIQSDIKALGATTYNNSRLTYFFHTDYMPKSVEDISIWKFRHIIDEMEWGNSNSTIADFHNHDAAAGLMENRCTGSYAYDAMTVTSSANHIHAVGKIKTMEAYISFFCEGRTLDLLQTFLLQTGTFEHDSSIQWFLSFNEASKNLLNFKKKVNEIMNNKAFWPENVINREILNIDDKSKIIVTQRSNENEKYIIIINFSAWKHHNYKVGVKGKKNWEPIFNSDEFKYSGFGLSNYPKILENKPSKNFELLENEIELGVIAPYGIIVLKEIQ